MKRSLFIVLAALLALAVAVPASAATLTLGGALQGQWYLNSGTSQTYSQDYLRLRLNAVLKEGAFTTGEARFTLNMATWAWSLNDVWYGAWNSKPVAFWVSNNVSANPYRFASLADPLGTAVRVPNSAWVARAHGDLYGTALNLYVAETNSDIPSLLARTTTPFGGVTLGTVVTFEDGNPRDVLTLGADVMGKIPGIGGNFNLAAAASLERVAPATAFEPTSSDPYWMAYTVGVSDVVVGPVTGYAKLTGVGYDFEAPFQAAPASGHLLEKYAGYAAFEAGVKGNVELGLPMTVGLDNALWMEFDFSELEYNETTVWAKFKPVGSLEVTGKVAYVYPVDDDPGYDGFKVMASATGSPAKGLTLNADTYYIVNDQEFDLFAWGTYVNEFTPGVVEKAKLTVAGVVDISAPPTSTNYYGFGGVEFTVNPSLSGKVGYLTQDATSNAVGAAEVSYRLSEQITLFGNVTARNVSGAQTYMRAGATTTVGTSTFTAAYGQTGLGSAPTSGFNSGKPWSYLFNAPSAGFDKDLFTFTMSVPF